MKDDLLKEYVQALNKMLELRKQLVRDSMRKLLKEGSKQDVTEDVVNVIADTANNTFAKGIENYERYELFDGWEHELKNGQFIAK